MNNTPDALEFKSLIITGNIFNLKVLLIHNKVIKLCVKYVNNLYWFYILKKTYHIAINKILRSSIYNYGLGLKLSIKNCGLELLQQ